MSKTLALLHIVFATKRRVSTIPENLKGELYNYICGISRNKNTSVIAINGTGNHIHMLVDLSPTISLSEYVRDIKQFSNRFMKADPRFFSFESWGVGYYAVSVGIEGRNSVINYIKNQQIHHYGEELLDEMRKMAERYGISWYPDDWS